MQQDEDTVELMHNSSAINWIAGKVTWNRGNCDHDEIVGHFQTDQSAEIASVAFKERHQSPRRVYVAQIRGA
jgi:hypothetical protein